MTEAIRTWGLLNCFPESTANNPRPLILYAQQKETPATSQIWRVSLFGQYVKQTLPHPCYRSRSTIIIHAFLHE